MSKKFSSKRKKWKRKKSELVFDEKYFKVRKDRVELPDGRELDWFYWDSPDSVMVIGLTKKKKIIMNRQYRYLVGEEVLELSAGYIEEGENIKDATRREFEEESGYKCGSLVKLSSVYETYGQLNRKIHIFFAKDLSKSEQKLEQHEDIKVELMDFEKVVNLALENKIADVSSAYAILLLNEKIRRGELRI